MNFHNAFHNILFERAEDDLEEQPTAPQFFVDLNLDQVVETITAGRDAYNLKPFFYTPLKDVSTINYRHEVMQDLEDKTLYECIRSFGQRLRTMREYLAQAGKLSNVYQKQKWFLDAVGVYCEAVQTLASDLALANPASRGLLAFRDYVAAYAASDAFTSLVADTAQRNIDLASVKYTVHVKEECFTVRKYDGEGDYSAEVGATFEKFKQGAVKEYLAKFRSWPEMTYVEEVVVDFVARLYPDVFRNLQAYCTKHVNYLDPTIALFDRQIQFYLAYLDFVVSFKRSGLSFCYPEVSDRDKEVCGYEGFDLALANKLLGGKTPVVCNDFYLKGKERIFVVSGPNQGGKTTFARTFGQLHYLAALGCQVPGKGARLFLFDKLFTHFEKEENIENLRGKLEDDLFRIHAILDQATPRSIIIMNEIFTSTTLQDAIFLSKKILEKIVRLDLLCVCVTFIDELSSLSEKTVSVASTVVPDNPGVRGPEGTPLMRTFKIVRKPADGLAYALSIAEKHRLTYNGLKERLTP